MKQEHFLKMAKEASKRSDHTKHKLGCVIVKRNRVLGVGFNMLKTHPRSYHSFKNMHAEVMAVIKADFKVAGSTVYVFRQQKCGTWAMAKPCDSCRKFLIENGVVKVVYSFEGSYKQERLD